MLLHKRKFCECGCRIEVKNDRRYVYQHQHIGKTPWNKKFYKKSIECKCGCGKLTKPGNNYIFNHHIKNRKIVEDTKEKLRKRMLGNTNSLGNIPWNKGLTKHTDERVNCYVEKARASRIGKKYPSISKALKGRSKSKEEIEKQRKSMIGKNKGKKRPDARIRMLFHNPNKNPCSRFKASVKLKQLWQNMNSVYHSESYWTKRRKSENRKPNKQELVILNILDQYQPNKWKYVGDYSFWIKNVNPDFVNVNGRKKIVELDGCYWHKCPECFPSNSKLEIQNVKNILRDKTTKQFGYDTLHIWGHELKNIENLTKKIINFIEE